MKRSIKLAFGAATFAASALFLFTRLGFSQREIMFRSEESRTVSGGDVFNTIKFIRADSKDIWMMNQSHDGGRSFERLAIVVEKKVATFYQLAPGALEWKATDAQREYKVSCGLCHSNGPRAIRPQDAQKVRDWFQTAAWNLRIKLYPRLEQRSAASDFVRKTEITFAGEFANSPLTVGVCTYCHREDGPVARGTLKRQQALAISRMVENGHMPPFGLPFPAEERKRLERFLNGFD